MERLKYNLKRMKDSEIPTLIDEAIKWKKMVAPPSEPVSELHSMDVKVIVREDGEIEVWRLDSWIPR